MPNINTQKRIERADTERAWLIATPRERTDLRFFQGWLLVASAVLIVSLLASGCTARVVLVKQEQIGPASVEIWKDTKAQTCQRRTYFGSYYYHGPVPCP
jgi:hypothetical protein